MKLKVNAMKIAAVTGMTAALVVGCSTPKIQVSMNVAGEVKMNGVSKIAIADFNTLPGDPFSGVASADEETRALAKRAVAAAFYASPMYQIVDMDIERDIHDDQGVNPKKHYDAIIYGRLWWDVASATRGQYPEKYTLSTWSNVPVPIKNPLTGKTVVNKVPVTTQMRDVIAMHDYETQSATLMLTLSIYRLEKSGDLVKIVDTYQVSDQGFTLMNGTMKLDGSSSIGIKDDNALTRLQAQGKSEKSTTAYEDMFAKKSFSFAIPGAASEDAAPAASKDGKLRLTQDTVSMPTELQIKMMLANSISRNLSAKIAPSKSTFDISADLSDDRLVNLLKNGAYESAREYSLYMIRNKLGKQICAELVKFLPEFAEPCAYPVPDSTKKFEDYNKELIQALSKSNFDVYFYTLGTAHEMAKALKGAAEYNDEMLSYLGSEDLDIYFYALGICKETKQDMDQALEYYRFAFNVNPAEDYALGISRVYLSMGEAGRLRQTKNAVKRAAKKADVE